MNVSSLAQKIAREFVLSKAEAERLIAFVTKEITESLQKGESITFRNFGSLHKETRQARLVTPPQQKKRIFVPEKNTVTFRPGKHLLAQINPDLKG